MHVLGMLLFTLYDVTGIVDAGRDYKRDSTTVDGSSIYRSISGVSEMQCLHRCKRDEDCKKSLYEKGGDIRSSNCHFLREGVLTGSKGVDGKRGVVHEEIEQIGT